MSLSEDMSPYCSAHDEWLLMKLCMYVGYHDANNVSNFGGDSITFKKTFDCSSMEGHTSLSTAIVLGLVCKQWYYYCSRYCTVLVMLSLL